MNSNGGLLLGCLVGIAVAAGSVAAGSAAAPADIQRLAWLTGCWESANARRTIEERWLAPRAHSMLNVGRTVRGDSLFEYELVVLREQGERFAYEAHPSGQLSTVFLSIVANDSMVVFENAEHDFPQRVGYRRLGGDSLVAWIEGATQGRTRRIEFPYGRVNCEE